MAPPANYKGEPTPWLQELHRRLEAFKTKTFPGKAVSAITLRDVERYFEKRPGGPKSKNMDRGILREFFRWARKHRYTDSDPTDGLHNNKKWKEPRRQARSLTRADEVALLKACREKYTVKGIKGPRGIGGRKGVPRHLQAKGLSQETGKKWDQTFTPPAWLAPLVILALRTALRMGNLLRLDWRHVDLKKQSIRIPAEEMKNKTDLEIPLHPEAQVLLAELKAKAVNLRVLEASGSPVPDRVAVGRAFRRAVKRAKLNPPITFHGLRKVAATRMLQGGADLKTVMAIGGWNDPGTLLRLYAAATEDAKRKAIGTL
jgi:integrase